MSPRMAADERRTQVLEAAMRVFATGGYFGTSTDAVAREAGVSQPYVVRMFGSKLQLFLEVFEMAADRIDSAFRAVLDDGPFDPDDEADWERLGMAYVGLLTDRDFLQVMQHGFSAGGVPEIGAAARACMSRIFATIQRTGCTDDRARDFVAQGMLLNVMFAMRAHEHLDHHDPMTAKLTELVECAFGDALPFVVGGSG